MKQNRHGAPRTLILLRYVILISGSIWWLIVMLSHARTSRSILTPVLLLAGIAFNIALDVVQRTSQSSRAVQLLLRHQMLFDCITLNLFLGSLASPVLTGEPVYWGGTRILPFDITFITGGILIVLASILLQNELFFVYLGTTLASIVAGQVIIVALRQNISFSSAFLLVNWGFTAGGLASIAGIGIFTYLIGNSKKRDFQVMSLRIAEATRDRERSQAAFHKLSFLTAIIHDMSSSQTYQQALETITDRAALFFNADDALIATIDSDLKHLSVAAAKSEYREQFSGLRITRGEGILGRVFEGDAPELIKNAMLDPRAVQIYGTPEEPESMMAAPLRKGSQKYGIVSVSRIGIENPFTEDDLALFTSFANIAASIFDNATMFEVLKRKNFTLTVTNQLSSAILSPLPLDEEIPAFLSIIKESFQLSRINLLMVENDRFTRFFAVPPPKETLSPQETLARMNTGKGIVGQTLHDRTIINIPDVTMHANYINADPSTASELGIPLKSTDGRITAVLNLESGQKDYFSNDVTADILAIAGEIQEFLQGRLIWEEVKQQRNIREALNRAELENISVSTLEEAVSHLTRLMAHTLPERSGAVLLENVSDTVHPWKSLRTARREDAQFLQTLDNELCARLATTHSLVRSITGLLQERKLLVRQLNFEQRLVGFVILGADETSPLTAGETSAFNLFMAYAESIVQKMFLKQRTERLTTYRIAAKELIDASLKHTDLRQFLAATARKLQRIVGADASAYIPFEPDRHRFDLLSADANGFSPETSKEPALLQETLSNPGTMVIHTEMTGETAPIAPGATTELALHVTLEGFLYGVFYIAFLRPVFLTEEEHRMMETFVSDCSLVAENILYVHRIDELSVTDELTGLGNYRAFVAHSTEQSERTARFGEVFSLLFFDIDDFKRYNDTYSHLDGNLALQGIADILRHSIRSVDAAYRYGGEEFVVLMPGASSADARKAAERIRSSIERNSTRDRRRFRSVVTVSGGIASFDDRVSDPKNLLLLADLAMYQAKKSGKNAIYLLDTLASRNRAAPGTNE